MSKILAFVAVVVLPAILVACDAGSILDPNTKKMENDAVGRLEAQGFDLRVYEFTPQTQPGYQCIFVAGEQKAGLYCIQKGNGRSKLPPSGA